MLELHYAPKTISVAVAIALEETGQTYTLRKVDFASGAQQGAAYLKLNPKGRVPTLIADGATLTETGAILEFIAPKLVPQDPWAAAKMRELSYYLAGTMHVAHAHKMRGARWVDDAAAQEAMQAKVPETMTACCAYLEATLALAPFAMGAEMTAVDPYLFMVAGWAEGDGVDMGQFPKLRGFLEMMTARDSVKIVTAKGLL